MQLKHFKYAFLLITFISLLSSPLPAKERNELTIDFSERFRLVSWDNPITLESSKEGGTTFTRNRTSLGLKWFFSKKAEIYFKITNEFRIYLDPENDFNIHELFVDNLYLKVRNIFNLPVTLTLGRQNVFLGEGFVVLDGSTYDGSRSAYFDAIRADINLRNTGKISLFHLYSQKTDELLPVLNGRDQLMSENDIKGFGIYYQGKIKRTGFDLYFLNKKTDISDNKSWDLRVNTFGGKVILNLRKKLNLTAEFAFQKGTLDGRKISSLGGHFHLDRELGNRLFRKLTIGGVWLSGDDPDSEKLNGWYPPFSRWPKWSDSYIYTFINEGGIAYWSNFSSIYFSLDTRLFRKGSLKTTLHLLGAPVKNKEFPLYPFPGGGGNSRGTLILNKLNFSFSKSLTGHFLWEYFRPGNFYFNGAKNYNWIRFELMYKTKTRRK